MKDYKYFVETYLYYVPSDIAYVSKKGEPFSLDNMVEERCESNRKYDIMSMELDWIFRGRYEARASLPRSRYRRLSKARRRRMNNLRRQYK